MTEELENQIIALYEQGYSARSVAEQIKRSKNGVLYVLHKHNVNTNNREYDLRKHTINDDFFNKIDTQEKAYFLGLIMADGNILDDNTFQLTLEKTDALLLETLKDVIQYSGDLVYDKSKKYCTLRFKSKQICDSLKKYNITPRKSLTLEPPTIDKNLYKHLVRGYFDGDGSIWFDKTAKSYCIQFVSTRSVLEEFINNMNWKNNKLRIATKNNNYIYRLSYRGNNLVKSMLTELYEESSIHMERKYIKYLQCKELVEENERNKNK